MKVTIVDPTVELYFKGKNKMMVLDLFLVISKESQFIVQSNIFHGGLALTNEETVSTSGVLVNPTGL